MLSLKFELYYYVQVPFEFGTWDPKGLADENLQKNHKMRWLPIGGKIFSGQLFYRVGNSAQCISFGFSSQYYSKIATVQIRIRI